MGTSLTGTLFLFETLTAVTFSFRGARTLSDEPIRSCVLIAKGRGHQVAGGIKMFPGVLLVTCLRHGCCNCLCATALVAIEGALLYEDASAVRVTLILPILTWTVLISWLNVLSPLS